MPRKPTAPFNPLTRRHYQDPVATEAPLPLQGREAERRVKHANSALTRKQGCGRPGLRRHEIVPGTRASGVKPGRAACDGGDPRYVGTPGLKSDTRHCLTTLTRDRGSDGVPLRLIGVLLILTVPPPSARLCKSSAGFCLRLYVRPGQICPPSLKTVRVNQSPAISRKAVLVYPG